MTERRVLVLDLDSVAQADVWCAVGPAEAQKRLGGVLRTAVLLEETLLLTAAQVLDGAYLLHLRPQGLADLLGCGHRLPITVACSEGGLVADLARMQSPGFAWSSTRAGCHDTSARDELQAQWLRAFEEGRFDTVAYDPLSPELDLDPQPADLPAGISPMVLEPVPTVDPNPVPIRSRRRSEVFQALDRRHQAGLVDSEQLARLQAWWNEPYLKLIADSNGASWLHFGATAGRVEETPAPSSPRWNPVRRWLAARSGAGARDLVLEGSLVDDLARIPTSLYTTVAFRARKALGTWREAPGQRALDGITYAVSSLTAQPPELRSVAFWTTVRVVAVVGLGLWASVGNVVDAGGSVALTFAAAAFVASVPWSDVGRLRSLSGGQLRGVMHVRAR